VAERPNYAEIEHTADVGVELVAADLPSAFGKTAAAMFDLISRLDGVGEGWRKTVEVESRDGDLENLLVRWLTELLYVHESEGVLLSRFDVRSLEQGRIVADVAGEPYDPARHYLGVEIKAATYHNLVLSESPSGYRVRVIFDV
jgi:SHS2 domain-containing protein